jgi:hypothetical protein
MLVQRSNRWHDPALWLAVIAAAVYLAILSYFVWRIVQAIT